MASPKLNQAEIAVISSLPENMRAQVTADLLSKKSVKIEAANSRRNTFQVKKYESGVLGVLGIGRQFPVGLYPDEWDRLFAHETEIKAALTGMPRRGK